MKVSILIAALLGVLLVVVVWRVWTRPGSPNESSVSSPAGRAPGSDGNPAASADLKVLFFADQSLEEITKQGQTTAAPWSLFASALAASRQGKVEDAKAELKKVLALPDAESRIRLWAWKGLRELGEGPPANVADEVQGVVCELHNDAGVGTIAAYSDGRARWLGGQGKVTVWEAPGTDAEIDGLIQELLKSTGPLVKSAPLSDKHRTTEPDFDHFRVSILTYGGIRIVEVYGPEIDEGHAVAPVLVTSVKLLEALSKKTEANSKAPAR